MRMIDADSVLEDIAAAKDHGGMGAIVAGTLKRYIKRQPTIDPESLRSNGSWITVHTTNGEEFSKCGNCQNDLEGLEDGFMFCPYCGAKMKVR